jgi:predicted Zn-dependent protease with MMP-like domain
MTELRKEPGSDFWEIVNFSDFTPIDEDELKVDEASRDRDLTALWELRILLETDAVTRHRAELIDDMLDDEKGEAYQQLIFEVQQKFGLTDEQMQEAGKRAEQRAWDKKHAGMEWYER